MDYRQAFAPPLAKLPIPARIELTEHELLMGASIATARMLSALRARNVNCGAATAADEWQKHLYGAFGEVAVAKYLGRYWTGAGVDHARSGLADVGPLEVRTSHPGGELAIRKGDPESRYVVHVTGIAPKFLVHGFIRAADGRRPEWFRDPGRIGRPAYFVPIAALRSIGELEAVLDDLEAPF